VQSAEKCRAGQGKGKRKEKRKEKEMECDAMRWVGIG
jgi:hypothetical protein